jgi:hypothetical protein
MPHTTIHRFIRVASSFGTELPYRPIFTMLGIEELDELVERVSVCELGVCF